MKKCIILFAFVSIATMLSAQYSGGPRLFLDIPHIYVASPSVEHISDRVGAGVATAFNVGSHWGVARIGGGALFSLEPKAEDVGGTFKTSPFAMIETGAGKYRSNGDQCAKNHRSAYTAMAKVGMRYDFEASQVDLAVGAELGYFYIRDVFRNTEVVLNAMYLTNSKVVTVDFGFKFFLNLRAPRD